MSVSDTTREVHTWCCHRCGHQWSAELEVRSVGPLEFCTEHGRPVPPPTASRPCPSCGGFRVDEHLEPPRPVGSVATLLTRPRRREDVPWWLQVVRLFVTHPTDPA